MPRKTKRDIAEAAIRDELTGYYLTADADQGLSSSHNALVNIANGGFGGSPDPERAILRRHELGATATRVTRVRLVRRALERLTAREQSVLWAAYGPVDWSRALDAAFGRGMGQRVSKRLGALVGVALLTDAVRRGYERDSAPAMVSDGWNRWERVNATRDGEPLYRFAGTAKPIDTPLDAGHDDDSVWNSEGGWLVSACIRTDESAMAGKVLGEAKAMLAVAVEAYRSACAEVAA